jgi:hypothetical protein
MNAANIANHIARLLLPEEASLAAVLSRFSWHPVHVAALMPRRELQG